MIVIVADTSALLASVDESHPAMEASRSVLEHAGLIVLSPLVLAEADHLLRRIAGAAVRQEFLDGIVEETRRGRVKLPEITGDVMAASRGVMRRYGALDLDLADAVNVVLASEFRTDAVLTFDRRDFRSIRPLTAHKTFRILPDDM
ncbi:type II toxin-antitoxin system VapC family toxin [Streptomyces purpureus]|uniref:Ribonuclease VapC n=1 Tax=Streptomyces purpureus TaxID=1951 RepID=A0A918LX90_9ACTN|nr:PIN domain-containing protein [Streptomyces purpureus]GGT66009.1 ribonuclease VapC26 [Streptomyces purpureus]